MAMKVLLVEQLGRKDYEYAFSAAKNYSDAFEVTCFTSDDTPRDVDTTGFRVEYGFRGIYEGSKIHKGIRYVLSLAELKRFIKKERFDILHFQWYEIPYYEKFFYRSLKKLYKPAPKIVMTVHGIVTKEQNRTRHDGLQAMYREADAILVHSEEAVAYFKQNYTVDCPIHMITPAFRDERDYVPMDKAEARKLIGVPLDKTIVLSFGTVREDKSIDLLFKAFPEALKRNGNLFLLSAGTLNAKDKQYYHALADKCVATGSAKIDFAYVSKEMEHAYYSAADILVVPYSSISQSGVAYCGLLYNLPLIGSDIPRLDLMAKQGINAEIFPKGSVEGLTEKIVELSTDPEKLARYAEGSKAVRERDFSIRRRVQYTEEAYRNLFK